MIFDDPVHAIFDNNYAVVNYYCNCHHKKYDTDASLCFYLVLSFGTAKGFVKEAENDKDLL